MKLFYTPNSPYARVTRIVALEARIEMEFVIVSVRDSADEILLYNPAAKVPTLVLDDGTVLSDSRLICEHFEQISESSFLAAPEDLNGRMSEGIAMGFLDGVAVWVRERRRVESEQSVAIIRLEERRARRCLDYFEQSWDPSDRSLCFAALVLATTIELIDARLPITWRAGRPGLGHWFDALAKRPSLQATSPEPLK